MKHLQNSYFLCKCSNINIAHQPFNTEILNFYLLIIDFLLKEFYKKGNKVVTLIIIKKLEGFCNLPTCKRWIRHSGLVPHLLIFFFWNCLKKVCFNKVQILVDIFQMFNYSESRCAYLPIWKNCQQSECTAKTNFALWLSLLAFPIHEIRRKFLAILQINFWQPCKNLFNHFT